MGKYTEELRFSPIEIFDFEYTKDTSLDEYFDGTFYSNLESLFKAHFAYNEIGCETFERFKHNLEERWSSIIDKYNYFWFRGIVEFNESRSEDVDKMITTNISINKDFPNRISKVSLENANGTSGVESKGGTQLIEVDFLNKMRKEYNLYEPFLNEFNDLFMGLF